MAIILLIIFSNGEQVFLYVTKTISNQNYFVQQFLFQKNDEK